MVLGTLHVFSGEVMIAMAVFLFVGTIVYFYIFRSFVPGYS